ncbi:hypothetical protein Tco_0784019 [Tanacetum coccineum]
MADISSKRTEFQIYISICRDLQPLPVLGIAFTLVGNDDSITSVLLEHDGLKRPVSWRAITTRLVFATMAGLHTHLSSDALASHHCDELKRVDKRCDSSRLGEVVEAALNSRIQQAERLLDSAREMEDLIAMLIAMWKAPLGCGNNNDQPDLGCQRFQMACQSAGLEGKEEEAVIWAPEKER